MHENCRHHLSLTVFCSIAVAGCAAHIVETEVPSQTVPSPPPVFATVPQPLSEPLPQRGYSGMSQIDSATYLVVHDTKSNEQGPRLGILRIRKEQGPEYAEVAIQDWKHPDGQANDLESLCALPKHPGEFLAAESGYWEGKYGRLFHIKLQGTNAEVLGTSPLPLLADNGKGRKGDNFEGIACTSLNERKILVILGERGGSERHPIGILRWGLFDPTSHSLTWTPQGTAGVPVVAPGSWPGTKPKRDISELYLDAQGNLWAAATADESDDGPFRSVIYKTAILQPDLENPIKVVPHPRAEWIIDGLKVEALSAPSGISSTGSLSFATEDEHLGGIWRPLYPPRKD